MSILYPVSGGFYTLAIRFLDPTFAFAMGWNYWLQWDYYDLEAGLRDWKVNQRL